SDRRTVRSGFRTRESTLAALPSGHRSPGGSLATNPVHRASRRLPGVVGGIRAESRLVGDDVRIATDLLRALRVPQEVRVVTLLPDEDEMRGGHEVGDEGATRGRARKGVRANAEPAT